MDQIAEAADVSPSMFFRYYPTKAETVLYDRLDPVFMESFTEQPAELSPAAALRAAMRDVLTRLAHEEFELEQARWHLIAEVPELRAALTERIAPLGQMVAEALAKRIGREPDDLAGRVWTGALFGGLMAAVFAALKDGGDVMAYVERGISQLEEHGLQL